MRGGVGALDPGARTYALAHSGLTHEAYANFVGSPDAGAYVPALQGMANGSSAHAEADAPTNAL